MARLKVLMSAYACEPGKGSEPGVGWNVACAMAELHDVWVITRRNNRDAIEAEQSRGRGRNIRFVYYDLPDLVLRLKRGQAGVQVYYYVWQLGIRGLARRLHEQVGFDVAHHVTFAKYWAPAQVGALRVPFVLGPVGGADDVPGGLAKELDMRGHVFEAIRAIARRLAEFDPSVTIPIRDSRVALAKTPESARRLRQFGAPNVVLVGDSAMDRREVDLLSSVSIASDTTRFVSIGNLIHLKGFSLGLRAFAAAAISGSEYWIVGDGPERESLQRLARRLGISDHVRFLGSVPRTRVIELLSQVTALVHPSLHDSGCWVCLEAMAAGRPVVCLDHGGPGLQVTAETGFKVAATSSRQVVADMASALRELAADADLRERMAVAGRKRVRENYTWEALTRELASHYAEISARKLVTRD